MRVSEFAIVIAAPGIPIREILQMELMEWYTLAAG
jgi:hypothetical protein